MLAGLALIPPPGRLLADVPDSAGRQTGFRFRFEVESSLDLSLEEEDFDVMRMGLLRAGLKLRTHSDELSGRLISASPSDPPAIELNSSVMHAEIRLLPSSGATTTVALSLNVGEDVGRASAMQLLEGFEKYLIASHENRIINRESYSKYGRPASIQDLSVARASKDNDVLHCRRSELIQAWGEPVDVVDTGGREILRFSRDQGVIEVHLKNGFVTKGEIVRQVSQRH